jgi:hypothetical protein
MSEEPLGAARFGQIPKALARRRLPGSDQKAAGDGRRRGVDWGQTVKEGSAMNRKRLVVLAGTVGLLIAGASQALMIEKSLPELAREADQIVVGTVTGMESDSMSEEIVTTHVTLSVVESLKGTPGTAAEFRILGGVVGDLTLMVSDAPEFQVGENVLVFLKTDEGGIARVWGEFQGKYAIRDGRAVNDALELHPEVVNQSPYEKGWLAEIEVTGGSSAAPGRWSLHAIPGPALFISDAGRIVSLESFDPPEIPATLRVYDLDGRALHSERRRGAKRLKGMRRFPGRPRERRRFS